jgi:hypothetical protein
MDGAPGSDDIDREAAKTDAKMEFDTREQKGQPRTKRGAFGGKRI